MAYSFTSDNKRVTASWDTSSSGGTTKESSLLNASSRATISANGVTVVALFAVFDQTITTLGGYSNARLAFGRASPTSLDGTGSTATITRGEVTVITTFRSTLESISAGSSASGTSCTASPASFFLASRAASVSGILVTVIALVNVNSGAREKVLLVRIQRQFCHRS